MQVIFLLGAPRSGTTWLQQLLGSHPQVATPQETHLYANYLRPLSREWTRQHRQLRAALPDAGADRKALGRAVGLPAVLTETQFVECLRRMAGEVLGEAQRLKPEATAVLEKTPSNSLVPELLLRLHPDAYFVHLVRDPRAVVASLSAIADTWGAGWVPSQGVTARARLWGEHTASAAWLRDRAARYVEVHYEELASDPSAVLTRLLAFLDLVGITGDQLHRLYAEEAGSAASGLGSIRLGGELRGHTFSRSLEPPDFRTTTGRTDWATRLSTSEQVEVQMEVGSLMAQHGYQKLRPTPRTWSAFAFALGRRFVDRAAAHAVLTVRQWAVNLLKARGRL